MNDDPIVFAMANPDPEIRPEDALGHARIIATGRSDYPNQINNVLCFPGIFRGALDVRAHAIDEDMKLAAAEAIAERNIGGERISEDYISPLRFRRAGSPGGSRKPSRTRPVRAARPAAQGPSAKRSDSRLRVFSY